MNLRNILDRVVGNKWTTYMGVVIAILGIIDANDVLPVAWDDMLEGTLAIVVGMGLVGSKDAATGSKPGAVM